MSAIKPVSAKSPKKKSATKKTSLIEARKSSVQYELPRHSVVVQEVQEPVLVNLRTPSSSPEPPRSRCSIVKRTIAERPVVDYSNSSPVHTRFRNPEMEQ